MLFQRLNEEQLNRVDRRVTRIRADEGHILFEQGDVADRFYLLLAGQVKLYRLSMDGDEKVIEVINPGSTFAEALMFLEKPVFPVCAEAMETSHLLGIDAADFIQLLRESVDTCLLLAGDLTQRLHGLLREINDLSLNSGTGRVAAYLIQNTPVDHTELVLHVPKHVLASRLSIKPESLSRIFRSLSNAGLIEIRGNHVLILDRTHLTELAQDSQSGENNLLATFHYPKNNQ